MTLPRPGDSAADVVPAHWPHRTHSRLVQAGGLRWHLQQWGDGAPLLLLHGTGASTHSWRGLIDWLQAQAPHLPLLAVDLPGQGYSEALPARRRGMSAMAQALRSLLDTLGRAPQAVVGHSAGAALMLRLALDGGLAPACRLVGLNAALRPFDGLAGVLYPTMARLLALNPLVPHLAAWRAQDDASVRRLIAATGSTLDEAGARLYAELLRRPRHVAGVLAMMADWDLDSLQRQLPQVQQPLLLMVGDRDGVVPPAQALAAAARRPGTQLLHLPQGGHLMHEEVPQQVGELLLPWLDQPAAQPRIQPSAARI